MKYFLYIVVDDVDEHYADLTLLSVCFLKKIHPDAYVTILCDPETAETLALHKHQLMSMANEFLPVECPGKTRTMKSRYLKTRMRKLLPGDFTYLDSDTIIRSPLDEIFGYTEPLSLARNHNRPYPVNLPPQERNVFTMNDWPVSESGEYFNSGVMVWRDIEEAHEIADAWAEAWDISAANGYHIDQPALNHALRSRNKSVRILDDRFNAQVRSNPATSTDAAIWHFFETDNRFGIPDIYTIARYNIRQGVMPDEAFIHKARTSKTHYLLQDDASDTYAAEILRNGQHLDLPTYEKLNGARLKTEAFATVCTIVSSDYLPYARTLLDSVRKFHPEIHFNIMVSDDGYFDPTIAQLDGNCFLHLAAEVCSTHLSNAIRNKYQQSNPDAFRWSCKPVFINHLIRTKGYEQVIYVDCDIHFFHPFEFFHEALRHYRVLLTPHWRTHWPSCDSSEYKYLFNNGLYNAGFIGASSTATDIMDWWAECCLYSCEKGSFEGEYVDQSILNLMPVYYEGVHILKHKGCNVAVWNRHECPRVRQIDGSILIDEQFPVVFIHFNAGIDRRTDYMLCTYYDAYLNTLKKYSEKAWQRETNQRKSGRDLYQENLPPWYKRSKSQFMKVFSFLTSFRKKRQIIVLGHPGTSLQCMGLWLRTIPGMVVSGMPVKDWSKDPIDDMHRQLDSLSSTKDALHRFLESMLTEERIDHTKMHWENPVSLLQWKYTLMPLPEGSLCWPELTAYFGKRREVIALISHPIPYALRMRTEESLPWADRQLQEADEHLGRDPVLQKWKKPNQDTLLKWVVKWCLDLIQMKKLIREGYPIRLVFDDALTNDTDQTLQTLCIQLDLHYSGSMHQRFNGHCVFGNNDGNRRAGENWRRLISNDEYDTAMAIINAMGLQDLPGFSTS